MRKIVFECVPVEIDAKALQLRPSEFGILMYMKMQDMQGKPPLSRDQLLEALPIGERTLDGALAVLKKRGLVERMVVFGVTPKTRAI